MTNDAELGVFYGVGRVAVEWARLEVMVAIVHWNVGGLGPDKGRIVTAGSTVPVMIDQIREFQAHLKAPVEEVEWLAAWWSETKPLQEQRNIAVHSLWLEHLDRKEMISMGVISRAARRGLRVDPMPEGMPGLHALADELVHAREELQRWLGQRRGGDYATSPTDADN